MPDSPLTSVIIPVYNCAKYLDQCITSVLAQTWSNIEIIIIDDGSTDDSYSIALKFSAANVIILKQENSGPSVARNSGLSIASGDYIQFLDADDIISCDKIASQMKLLIDNPGYVGLCTTVHFKNGSNPFAYPVYHEWIAAGTDDPADFLIKLYGGPVIGANFGGMIQPNAWLTPRMIIDKAGLWNEMRCADDDGEFFCRVLLASKGIKYSSIGINYYRKFVNFNSWSNQKSHEGLRNILKATELKSEHLLAVNNGWQAKLALSRLFWENAFNSFPVFKDLSIKAEIEAKNLAPFFRYMPYYSGLKHYLAR
jgi:glycosyltransferase involved in cell wall biosynthesis